MAIVDGVGVETAALNTGKVHPGKSHKSAAKAETEEVATTDTPAVQISLSEEALELLSDPAEVTGPGKSHESTAHRARAELELYEFAALRDLPFGKIVSTLAHNGDLSSLLPEPAADEVEEVSEIAEGDEATIIATTPENDIESQRELSDAELALRLLQESADAEE